MTGMPRFEIIEEIGSGQFSHVYKAKWLNPPASPDDVQIPGSPAEMRVHQATGQGIYNQNTNNPFLVGFSDQLNPQNSKHLSNNNTNLRQSQVHEPDLQNGGTSLDPNRPNNSHSPNQQRNNQPPKKEKYVALKKIKLYEIKGEYRKACIEEVKWLQRLNHRNIINYNISFIEWDQLYIVLDFADGGDLSKLIKYFQRKRILLSERTILKYFTQVCSAVEYIHSERIMHRDIKPANIFMTSDGCVKLGDFGLSRFFSQETIDAHSIVGTFYYMSPERIKHNGYSFSSDVWSLGCVLYELITLHTPFSIPNAEVAEPYKKGFPVQRAETYDLQWLVDKIVRADFPSLAGYSGISAQLRDIVTLCLDQNPEARPEMGYICQVVNNVYAAYAEPQANSTSTPLAQNRPHHQSNRQNCCVNKQ